MKEQTKKKKSIGKRIFLAILWLLVIAIAALVIAGFTFSHINGKEMNASVDAALTTMEDAGMKLTPVETGEYSEMTVYGVMGFDVSQYEIQDVGNLSVMTTDVGLMQMATVIITPFDKNLPLFSMDFMYILTNRKCYLEQYGLTSNRDDLYQKHIEKIAALSDSEVYKQLADTDHAISWSTELVDTGAYKAGGMDDDELLRAMMVDTLKCYADFAKASPKMNDKEKAEKLALTQEYTDNLIQKGGISTDVFKSSLGEEKTKDFFDRVLFGCGRAN